jgi:uncharacterized membrane protein (UPF0127 family)
MAGAFNQTKGTEVVSEVRVATSMWSRFWGLMGRRALAEDSGLLIRPCSSVHTFFMRFPIDVVFIARDGRVVKIASAMKPWRAALGGPGAHSALELNADTARSRGLEEGNVLELPEG